ncbi:MAG: transcription elongation factor GreA [Acholeplasmatales bacterium]|nr:transcription elongation factor GreA [Acholeplasmatales bacterium]
MGTKAEYELTQEGRERFESELKNLIEVVRPQNVTAIAEARAQGDLSENADYHAAREEQGKIEARILTLKDILKNSKVAKKKESFGIGSVVRVIPIIDGIEKEENTLTFVSTLEVVAGKTVSLESPIGKAFSQAKVEPGVIVDVKLPNGRQVKYKIVDIK